MKYLLSALFWFFATVSFSSSANAFGGTAEFLDFVAETDIPDQATNRPLSLCALKEKVHVVFIPLWFSAEEYVLATDSCDTDSFYRLNPGAIANFKAEGVLPQGIPEEPTLSSVQKATPIIWAVVVVAGIIFNHLKDSKPVSRGGNTSASSMSRYEENVLEIACRAALADGVIEPREVATVCSVAQSMTSKQIPMQQARDMIDFIQQQPQPVDYTDFSTGMGAEERAQILRVAMMVIGKPGLAEGTGKAFVEKLATDLLIAPEQRDAIAAAL